MSHSGGGGLRGRLQRSFGGPAQPRIVSQRSRGGGGGGGRGFARFMQEQNKLSTARNQQMMQQMQQAQGRARKAFGEARTQLGNTASSSIQRLREQGERSQGSAEQDLVSRGLGNTTIRTNVKRGITADVQRGETDIQSQLSQMMSNLSGQEAQFEMQTAQQGLQGFGMQSGGMEQFFQLLQMMQGGGF